MIVRPPEFERELAETWAHGRDAQLSAFGEELDWLTVVPAWTDRLARELGFPGADRNLAQFVERADEAGLCRKRRDFGEDGEPLLHFWMPASARADVVDWFRQSPRRSLRQRTLELAAEVSRGATKSTGVSRCVALWAALAMEARDRSEEAAAQCLSKEVTRLAAAGDTAAALDWLAGAEVLAAVVGGSLDSAVPRARRRIGLEYRRQQDEAFLRHFLERTELIAAVDALLDGPDTNWALHIAGVGGVGKTMLIRFLANRYARRRDRSFAVSRVDFDYLPPLYPASKPGQLLLELADELRIGVSTSKQEKLFDRFVERVTRAHEMVGSLRTVLDVPAEIRLQQLTDAVDAFVALCESLDRPVLLILDTCEELAKVRIGGRGMRAVDATFEILEALHERLPTSRVLFAGRRPLANRGAGEWSYDSKVAGPGALADLAPRTYLSLFEVRGYTRDEVVRHVTEVHGRRLGDEDLERLLASSPEAGRLAGLRVPESDAQLRYNPLDVETFILAGDPDAYVANRVVGRLERNERHLLTALPAVALFGRFDGTMLAPTLTGQSTSATELVTDLARQEWISISTGRDSSDWFLEVRPGILSRLRRHYEQQLPVVAARLGPYLAALVERTPLSEQPIDYAAEAVRLLRPVEAGRLWNAIAHKAESEARWDWLRALAERVLAPDEGGRIEESAEVIGGAVLASTIAALRHDDRDWDPSDAWDEVAAAAQVHPDPTTREWLEIRARLGRVAAAAVTKRPIGEEEVRRLIADVGTLFPGTDEVARPIGPALVSALEAVLEQGDAAARLTSKHVRQFLEVWSEHLRGALLASATCLAARVVHRDEGLTASWSMFAAAERIASESPAKTTEWADWVAPDSLVDRVRLEWLLRTSAAEHWVRMGTTLDTWLSEGSGRASTIDGERLVSYLLAQIQENRVPEKWIIELLEATDAYSADRRPRCVAHDRVPPLFLSVARAWLARGDVVHALQLLDTREAEALSQRSAKPDPATARAAQHEVIAIVRRMRLGDRIPQVRRYLEDPELGPAAWVAYTLAGPHVVGQSRSAPASRLHEWYRSLPTADDAAAARDLLVGTDPAIRLDAYEASLAAGRDGGDREAGPDDLGLAHDLMAACRGPAEPSTVDPWSDAASEHSGTLLRAWALGLPAIPSSAGSHRQAATVALEEGELLVLRLPEQGSRLLEYAVDRYEVADDPVGVVIAGTALALARLRMKDRPEAEAVLARVRIAYQRLEPTLPSWEALTASRAVDVSAVDSGWTDWVLRLRTCLHAISARPLTFDGPRPIELHLPQSEPKQWLLAEDSARSLRSRPRAILAGAVMAILAIVGTVLLVDSADLPADWYLEVALWSFLASVLIYLTRKGTLLFVRVEDLGGGRARVLVTPALRPAPSTRLTRLLGVVVLCGFFAYYWGLKLVVWRPLIIAYVSLGEVETGDMPPELRRRLRRWFPRPFGGRTATVLAIDPTLASVPWEAWLTSGSGSRARANPFRARPGGPAPAWPHWGRPSVLITAPGSWRLLFQDRWFEWGISEGEPATIAHAIGVPVLTTLGWRLRVDEIAGELGRSRIAPRSQMLLSPDDLVRQGTAIVLIMATPTETTIEPDRDTADALRQLADEVVAAGAYAAVTIPELPPDVAVNAVDVLRRRVRRPIGSKNAKRLIATVAKMRDNVAAQSSDVAGAEAAVKASMDICLVVSDNQPAESSFLDLPVAMDPAELPTPAVVPTTERRAGGIP